MLAVLTWIGLAVAILGFIFGFGFLYLGYRKTNKTMKIVGWVLLALGAVGLILLCIGLCLNSTSGRLQPEQTVYYITSQVVSSSTNSDVVVVTINGVQNSIGVNTNVLSVNSVTISTSNTNLNYLLAISNNTSSAITYTVKPGSNSSLTWLGPYNNAPTPPV